MWEHLDRFDPRWLESHLYALIDASFRDELPRAWPLTAVAPAFLGGDTARSPHLLHLSTLSSDDRHLLMGRMAQEAMQREDSLCSLLLACPAQAAALAHHLAQRMVLTIPGNATPKQFRYFDPGTFLQLPRLLGPQGMAWLLGPVESVLVPWAGHWTRLTRPGPPSAFRLQPQHIEALSRIGVINRTLLQCEPPTDAAAWIRDCTALDGVVRRAIEQHGLRRRGDLVAFAGHALQHHPRFDDHPRMQALLRRLRVATLADEIDYEELSCALSDADWQAICRDLPPAPTAASTKGQTT